MSYYYSNTSNSRALFKKIRIGVKLFVGAVMVPIAGVNLASTPLSEYVIKKASELYGFTALTHLNYLIGGAIIIALAGLFSRKFSSLSAYFLGVLAFIMAATQFHLFGTKLPVLVADGAAIIGSSDSDHGVVFALLALASTASVFAALLSVRRSFLNVQKQIAKI